MEIVDITTEAKRDSGDHEKVVMCQDPRTGLRAVIALHSTTLGPALGGTRFQTYATTEDALDDVLRLSRGMTYKNSLAGLNLGGGKAVVLGDPEREKSEELLLAYGRCVTALDGRYLTACDAGTDVADMDIVARSCPYTLGRSKRTGGLGDTSGLTAFGVVQGMKAAARHRWGTPTLHDRVVGVAGLGKVGSLLVTHLVDEGAHVLVTDIREAAVEQVVRRHPGVHAVATTDLVSHPELDVYAPCALGGALDDATAEALTADIICGAANNQLARLGMDELLARRGLLYVPDYLVNAGGAIQAMGELRHLSPAECRDRARNIFDVTLGVLRHAEETNITPLAAADHIARQRISASRD
ncbi:Leu/Phe/Val dehydrogenase [Streptomyces buecherae]|uniref:Valine dehydrogenase n=1 Tax=Streptomyces buecherae TaxID=2763006 RepID=A0A7H8N5Z5_9ACTN|nr:Glu/Leu/Phe/Val dehydrogenase dimerization domain-containing protein [Streptomyces buecherae]QKW49927.1 Glu/Leu/Phe/Val dehydrogenase [Streptomyces buecherae]